jgi:hypothetical protein
LNLRPPGYEHPDTRPRRLKHSPLTHTIPKQRVHTYRDVSPVPRCPGYTFGYTPHRPTPRPQSLVERLGRTQPFGHHALATHLQVHHGSPGLGWSPTALPDLPTSVRPTSLNLPRLVRSRGLVTVITQMSPVDAPMTTQISNGHGEHRHDAVEEVSLSRLQLDEQAPHVLSYVPGGWMSDSSQGMAWVRSGAIPISTGRYGSSGVHETPRDDPLNVRFSNNFPVLAKTTRTVRSS